MTNSIKRLIFILLLILTIYLFYLSLPFIIDVFKFLLKMIIPFLISFTVAYILQPLVVFVNKKVKRRSVSVFIVVFAFLGIIALTLYLIIPHLLDEVKVLIERMPEITEDIEQMLDDFAAKLDFLPESYRPTFDNLNGFFEETIQNISNLPKKIVSEFLSYFSIIIVIPMIIIYFLLDYEKILCYFRDYLTKKNKIHFRNYLGELNQTISSYIRGAFLVMIILIVTCTSIFIFMGLDFALFFAIIIAITNIIPYLGPYIGALFPVLYALIDSPSKALMVALAVFLVQTIESNFLTPYINSKQIKMHPIIVIFALLVFGSLFGILGMILAVPMLAIIRITFKYYNPFQKKVSIDQV